MKHITRYYLNLGRQLIRLGLAVILALMLVFSGLNITPHKANAATIEMGAAAILRDVGVTMTGLTIINLDNPAAGNGTIDTVDIYVSNNPAADVKFGIFYNNGGDDYVCRDSVTIGTIATGYHSYPVSLTVVTGDYIGIYGGSAAYVEVQVSTAGGYHRMQATGDYCNSTNETTYTAGFCSAISIYASGETSAPPGSAPPTVISIGSDNVSETAFDASGNITDEGDGTADLVGIVYSVDESYSSNVSTAVFSVGTAFVLSLTGLSPDTQYHWKAFAHSEYGYAYGSAEVQTTNESDSTSVISLTLTSTYQCISYYAAYNGDGNEDNTAIAECRVAGGAWKQTTNPTKDISVTAVVDDAYVTNPWYHVSRASIFGLAPNTEYEVRITFSDTDGIYGTNPISANITTRDDVFDFGGGTDYYVSTSGNDTDSGNITDPWQTIQYAVDSVSPGDNIYLRAGTFTPAGGTVTITTSGNSTDMITLSNYPGESVIIDFGGADIGFLFDGADYWRITGLLDKTKYTGNYNLWYGANATSARYIWNSLSFADNLGITMQNVGGTVNYAHGVIVNDASFNNVFEYILFTDFGYATPNAAVGMCDGSQNITVQWCKGDTDRSAYGDPLHYGSFVNANDRTPAGGSYNYPTGAGTIVRYCEATGKLSDLIGGGASNIDAKSGMDKDSDCYANWTHDTFDDGWEMEGRDLNVRAWNNFVERSYTGAAFHCVNYGPAYVIHNVFLDFEIIGLKIGFDNPGDGGKAYTGTTYILNNTFVSSNVTPDRCWLMGDNVGGKWWVNNIYLNNIWEAPGWIYDIQYPSGEASSNNTYDYNWFNQPSSYGAVMLIRVDTTGVPDYSTYTTVAAFAVATGQEEHGGGGYGDTYDPAFTSRAGYDYSVNASSPCIDLGTVILGINDSNSPWPYSGFGPDIGAFEYEESVVYPSVTTLAATDIGVNYANIGGTIDDTGGEDCSLVGVEWGAVSGVYTANFTAFIPPFDTGTYVTSVYPWAPGTPCYYIFFAINTAGRTNGAELSFLTKPAAPTNVSASDGTSSNNVTVTWTKSFGATSYRVYRDGVSTALLGDVDTYVDTGAGAPSITAGAASASDGSSTANISLSLPGISVNNGASRTYFVDAWNASGYSSLSTSDTGYRAPGVLSYQWWVSDADSDATYSPIAGGTTAAYVFTGATSGNITPGVASATDGIASHITLTVTGMLANPGPGQYFKCTLTAAGCATQNSTANRGYIGIGALTFQWYTTSTDNAIGSYSIIVGGTTNPYNWTGAPSDGSGRYALAVVSATGTMSQNTTADRGYTRTNSIDSAILSAITVGLALALVILALKGSSDIEDLVVAIICGVVLIMAIISLVHSL